MPRQNNIEVPGWERARLDLSRFVEMEARQTAKCIGFEWIACENAPSDYDTLAAAYDASWETHRPLPVSSKHSSTSIFTSPAVNAMMRFVHDVAHVRTGLTFADGDELQLSWYHLNTLLSAGFTTRSLPYQMLKADSLGQPDAKW